MRTTPSPATVARALQRQAAPRSTEQALQDLRSQFPNLVNEAVRFGVDIPASIEEWADAGGEPHVSVLLSEGSSPFQAASVINEVVQRNDLPLLSYLVVEATLSERSARIAGYLRSTGTSLEKVLSQLAARLGEAFLKAAFAITWQRRAVFARLLESARSYLQWTRQAQILAGLPPARGVETRLGIAAVLATRFGAVPEHELREARAMLLQSHTQGSETALEYFVEASLWLFDLFDDRDAIMEAAQQLRADAGAPAADSIMAGHLWLRLAGIASRPTGVLSFLSLGREVLARWRGAVPNRREEVSVVLLEATFDQMEADARDQQLTLSTRGILFPFGHRRPDTPTSPLFARSLPSLIDALRQSDRSSDFVYRDLTASYLSMHARLSSTITSDAVSSLQHAILIRDGSWRDRTKPLNRAGIEAEQAADKFLLGHLTGSIELRRSGFVDLLKASEPDDLVPRYLTVVAKEVEERGALKGALLPGPQALVLAIRAGDSAAIFEEAARAAYQSADLTRVLLGGRGGVVTLRDSDGVAGQTFVYKRTHSAAMARDAAYSRLVADALNRLDLVSRYGLIEHVTVISDIGEPHNEADHIVSVRRFSDGVPLLEHLEMEGPSAASGTLIDVAEFLALIHYAGLPSLNSDGTRTSLKHREIGRWLRALQMSDDERSEFFARWWGLVNVAPLAPRRDAHPLNWLIGTDDKIRAVDLESLGARPLGYELAQLVEDGQTLQPGAYEQRTPIVEAYLGRWRRLTGTEVDSHQFRVWYDAGVLARAVRAISYPSASSASRAYGGDLLVSLASKAEAGDVRVLAAELAQRWNRMKGRASEVGARPLAEAERRRISRAMSYHLRHDAAAPANKAGWVHVDELAQLMREAGHRVSSSQLLLIAGALGEQRFQLEGEDVRAAYGHSLPIEIEYEARKAPLALFHATPTRNLASIFEARAGLRVGSRQWVHLTESCDVAVNAARRQMAAVSVLEIEAQGVEGLVHAAGSTWLAPRVPVESISIVAVRRARELTRASAGAI